MNKLGKATAFSLEPLPYVTKVFIIDCMQLNYFYIFFKKWANPGLFFIYFRLFYKQLTPSISIIFATVGIGSADLWCRRRPLQWLSLLWCDYIALFSFLVSLSVLLNVLIVNQQLTNELT